MSNLAGWEQKAKLAVVLGAAATVIYIVYEAEIAASNGVADFKQAFSNALTKLNPSNWFKSTAPDPVATMTTNQAAALTDGQAPAAPVDVASGLYLP